MAENKKGVIAISIVSLLLVGTAVFFVVKGLKAKPKPQEGGGGGERLPIGGGQSEIPTSTEQTTQSTKTGFGAFLENLTKGFQQGITTKDPSTFEGFKFPIRRTQKNESVKRLQQLLLTYDRNSLPRFGADSFFGTETETALQKIIGKKQVDSQADILAIESKIKEKASQLMSMAFINQSLGIKLY
jgi:hypothetical protein